MKKIFALMLSIVMTVSLLAGCGDSSSTVVSSESAESPNTSGAAQSAEDPGAGDPVSLDLVTAGSGTSWYSYGAIFNEILPRTLPNGSTINAVAEGGSTSNTIQVSTGVYPLGIGYNIVNKWAYDGTGLYTEPYDNLRGIAGYLDTFYYVAVVRKDAGWSDLAEVAEKHLPIHISCLPAGNMGNVITSMIFEWYGFTFEDLESWGGSIEYADWDTSVENLKAGRTDFICHNITQGHAALTELTSTTDMTFIQFPQELIDSFVNERGFSPETLPGGNFRGQDEDLVTFGVTSNIFCSADLPDYVAYDIAKALCENVEDVNAGHAALQRFTAESASDPAGLGLPLHPGAEQYYKDAGILVS